MSVTHPILKMVKGYILEIMKPGEVLCVVDDDHPCLMMLCQSLEEALRLGLVSNVYSPFGLTQRDYWNWVEQLYQSESLIQRSNSSDFTSSVQLCSKSKKIMSAQGRGRLFIRSSLCSGSLHYPLEIIVRNKSRLLEGVYDKNSSILGDDILGEIFLSLVYQLSQISFKLNVDNASFLDSTWSLPIYKNYLFSPVVDLGIYLGHVNGRAIVLRVDQNSPAAQDNKIEPGDVIDDLFGLSVRGWKKHRIAALFKQNNGVPASIGVLKSRTNEGNVFSGIVSLLKRVELDSNAGCHFDTSDDVNTSDVCQNDDTHTPIQCGQIVNYLGTVDVGALGDVSVIEGAIDLIVAQKNVVNTPVFMLTQEIGVKTVHRKTKKLLLNHSYTEISSCGRKNDVPLLFGYVAGNTTCSIASNFRCYIFKTDSEQVCKNILMTLCDGFHRTHWAV